MTRDLTICSVSFRSRSCLGLNWRLTAELNRKAQCSWLVAENTDAGHPETLDPHDDRFQIVPGVPCQRTGPRRGSYHHAASLNPLVKLVQTRFVLFLDPDFFLVRPEWIHDVVEHMKARRLSFFGAPYHPSRVVKYRYFPCVCCLFVDLDRVPRERLDFTPENDEIKAIRNLPWEDTTWGVIARSFLAGQVPNQWETPPGANAEIVRHAIRRFLVRRIWMMKHPNWPMLEGRSRDTGWRVYRYFGSRLRYARECLTPAWHNPLSWRKTFPLGVEGWLLRRLIPDNLCRYPKRPDYATTSFFAKFGLPDLNALGWEENLWRGEPFGFHVGGLFQGLKKVSPEELEQIVGVFMDRGRSELAGTEGVRKAA